MELKNLVLQFGGCRKSSRICQAAFLTYSNIMPSNIPYACIKNEFFSLFEKKELAKDFYILPGRQYFWQPASVNKLMISKEKLSWNHLFKKRPLFILFLIFIYVFLMIFFTYRS